MSSKPPFVPHAARAEWHDMKPIPQVEAQESLCPIMYSPQYSSAMDMFRAVFSATPPEHSERSWNLTSELIKLNPAHYTIWSFRYDCVLELGISPIQELEWCRVVAGGSPKNYQIWQYRRKMIMLLVTAPVSDVGTSRSKLSTNLADDELYSLIKGELDFSREILVQDAKNYHTWSFRQWLIDYFQLWDETELSQKVQWREDGRDDGPTGELPYTQLLLHDDLRNNSAWNHRFFIITWGGNCNASNSGRALEPKLLASELSFVKEKIALAPNNVSGWSYLRGLLRYSGTPLHSEKEFVHKYMQRDEPVVQALGFFLDLLLEEQESDRDHQAVKQIIQELVELDWVRRKYWTWRGASILA